MENSQSNTIKKCRASLVREGVVKSVLCGMAIGLAASFVVAFITWFFTFKGLWLSLGLGLGMWAGASVLFYFFAFKPTNRDVMKRLDRAGLEERMITMYELRDDDSYIAQRQRTDASAAFTAAAGAGLITMQIPAFLIALACIFASLGLGWTTVTALSDYGVIPTGMELIADGGIGGVGRYFTVTYEVGKDGGGTLSGNLKQKVKAGESTEAVTAVGQYDGEKKYCFKMWIDEQGNEYRYIPYFTFNNVQSSKTFTAIFELVDGDEELNPAYYFDPDNIKHSDNKNNSDEEGPDDPSKTEPTEPDNKPGLSGPPSGADSTANDKVIDGQTEYGEVIDQYGSEAMGDISSDTSGRPPELIDMIEGFYGSL